MENIAHIGRVLNRLVVNNRVLAFMYRIIWHNYVVQKMESIIQNTICFVTLTLILERQFKIILVAMNQDEK